jgi:putative DNA primase/helicase
MNAPTFLARLQNVRRTGDGWSGRCPGHDDNRASLSIKEGEGGRILIKCHAGCSAENVVAALGLTMQDLFPGQEDRQAKPHIVVIYDYVDEHGGLLFQTVRYHPKNFKQRRPDPDQPGQWIYNVKNVPRVLYRLQGAENCDRIRANCSRCTASK